MAAYRIFEDRSGNLLTSAGNSVYRLPRGKDAMDPILPQQGGRALFVDQEGDLWAGTQRARVESLQAAGGAHVRRERWLAKSAW